MEAIRQPGERVVVGLVLELLFQLGHLCQRVLQPAVLEQDACVTGERLEQVDVLAAEGGDVADPVADDQQPERPVLAAEGADDRIVEVARGEHAVQVVRLAPPAEQCRPARRRRCGAPARRPGPAARRSASAPRCRRRRRCGSAARRCPAAGGGSRRTRPAGAACADPSSWPTAWPNSGAPCVARIDSYRNSTCSRCSRCAMYPRNAKPHATTGATSRRPLHGSLSIRRLRRARDRSSRTHR